MSEQPPTYPSGPVVPQTQGGSGLAVAALVLGIVSLVLFCIPYIGVPGAIIAIVLGIIARGKANRGEATGKGMATAGLICGIFSIALVLLLVLGALAFVGFAAKHQGEFEKTLQQMTQPSREQSTEPSSPQTMLPTAVWPA